MGPKIFLFEICFGTNKISGLKVLGPIKVSGLEKHFGFKKNFEKKCKAKLILGPEILFEKLWVQKNFDLKKRL